MSSFGGKLEFIQDNTNSIWNLRYQVATNKILAFITLNIGRLLINVCCLPD